MKMLVVCLLLTVGFTLAISARLFYLQVYASEEYQQKALDQQLRVTQLTPKRGSIYDRNMTILARSATVWTITLSPANIKSEEQKSLIAENLSRILDVAYDQIIEKANKTASYYQIIKRKVEQTETEEVRQFLADNDIQCVGVVEDSKRYYPYDNFLSCVLGFTGVDNQGLAGLEAYYDSYLSGTPGRQLSAKNAWGTDMPYTYDEFYEPKDGYSLVLTIDEDLQHFLEKQLETAVEEHNVQNRAVGIAMDPKTGAILALAVKGDFDPNDPFTIFDEETAATLEKITDEEEHKKALDEAQQQQWRNKAVSDTYEPGSVFKTITAASALEEGVVTQTDGFYCSGSLVVEDRTIHCDRTTGHGQETFLQGLQNSCNPVFMQVGARLGSANFFKYFEAFGFTERTGIDLPGEAQSIYHSKKELEGPVELAVSSFGQTFKVTPIQMLTAVCTAINGGNLVQPHVVDHIIDSEGKTVEAYDFSPKRQVISEEISRELALMLETVVSEGGGKNCRLTGYRIGGKSGTSEKLDVYDEEGNQVDERIASFMAFAPANDPQIAVLVLLDQPHPANNLRYGSVLAAPVCREFLADALPYLGIEPEYKEDDEEAVDINVPYLLDYGVLAAQTALRNQGLDYQIKGEGSSVVKQVPEAGMPIPKNGTVVLYTESNMETHYSVVPYVIGMTPSQANAALVNAGFNIRITGSGSSDGNAIASKQSVEEGTQLESGTVIEVEFVSEIVIN